MSHTQVKNHELPGAGAGAAASKTEIPHVKGRRLQTGKQELSAGAMDG